MFYIKPLISQLSGVAQSVLQHAIGRIVRTSYPGGGRRFPRLCRPALGPT